MLASFQLTNAETALLSAYVLLYEIKSEQLLVAQIRQCLVSQLAPRIPEADDYLMKLLEMLPRLKTLSTMHVQCLLRFQSQTPIEFPPLYKELFATEHIIQGYS